MSIALIQEEKPWEIMNTGERETTVRRVLDVLDARLIRGVSDRGVDLLLKGGKVHIFGVNIPAHLVIDKIKQIATITDRNKDTDRFFEIYGRIQRYDTIAAFDVSPIQKLPAPRPTNEQILDTLDEFLVPVGNGDVITTSPPCVMHSCDKNRIMGFDKGKPGGDSSATVYMQKERKGKKFKIKKIDYEDFNPKKTEKYR